MSGFADFPLAKGLSAIVEPLIPGIEIFLEAGHPGKSWSAAMHG